MSYKQQVYPRWPGSNVSHTGTIIPWCTRVHVHYHCQPFVLHCWAKASLLPSYIVSVAQLSRGWTCSRDFKKVIHCFPIHKSLKVKVNVIESNWICNNNTCTAAWWETERLDLFRRKNSRSRTLAECGCMSPMSFLDQRVDYNITMAEMARVNLTAISI